MDKNWLPNEHEGIHRRTFLAMMGVAGATFAGLTLAVKRAAAEAIKIKEMKKGDDGSVTLYFGPKAPEGLENNWIPTAGKKPSLFVRFYGPTDAFFDKTFKMPDVKLVK